MSGENLKRGTVHCPKHKKVRLHFEQVHGMRMIRDGVLHAHCPECKDDYKIIPDSYREV